MPSCRKTSRNCARGRPPLPDTAAPDTAAILTALPGHLVGADLAAAAAVLHRACFSPGWDQAALAALLAMPGAGLYVLSRGEDDDRLAAMLLARAAADEAEIITLCVDPSCRGNGFGKRLIREMGEHLGRDGVRTLFLEVADGNRAAKALYRDCGFRVIGRRRAYYADGDDAIIMRRADMI